MLYARACRRRAESDQVQREPKRKRARSGLKDSARCCSRSPARRIKRPPLSLPRARVAVTAVITEEAVLIAGFRFRLGGGTLLGAWSLGSGSLGTRSSSATGE